MVNQLKIAPSLLSCDFSNLETEVKNCEKFGADILHVDVMDGHFVPNITIGPLIVKAIRPHSSLPIDCHLMISNPDNFIDDFADAGADYISVHAETCNHLHRTLSKIKERNCKAGVVLNPITPLQYAYEAAEYCDFILLMSVNPGFGGQSFITSFLDKCRKLRNYLDSNGLSHVEIEVDGGVKIDNINQVVDAGANMIVSGSGLFKGNFEQNIKDMKLAAISGQ
ncbi:MAG: ribulose-phosphate 3-epimerase [Candidatus Kapaibacterium sp.]